MLATTVSAINCQIVRKFVLLYFRFYICNGNKFITLTVFNCERTAKRNSSLRFFFNRSRDIIGLTHFYKIDFAPVVCACFYLYTAFSCHYDEIHHAVRGKTSLHELPFWVITVLK